MSVEVALKAISPARLEELRANPMFPAGDLLENSLILDEYALTFMRHEPPRHPTLFEAVLGGELFPDGEQLEGAPRYLMPDEVQRLTADLGTITNAALRVRYDQLKSILGLGGHGSETAAIDYLSDRFWRLVQYYRGAARRGDAMLLTMY